VIVGSRLAGSVSQGLAALLALAALALPQAALAQAVPQPPSREDLSVGRENNEAPRPSKLTVEGDIERGPCPLADPSFAEVRVNFSSVEFSGLPGVPATTLDAAWRDQAGQDLPIVSLCQVRDRASAILRDLGYLAAVQIPPQRIDKGGVVKMDVLAAKLVEVELRGKVGPSAKLIAAYLGNLTDRPWFNIREAERYLLLLQDFPGYNVRLTLRSAQRNPGEVIGTVQVERQPVELVVGAQNLAAKATGREGGFAEIAFNDLIGRGDRTTFSYYNTFDFGEQRIFRATHELALNADGLRLGGSILFGHSHPSVAHGDFSSNSLVGDVYLSTALIRRQPTSLFGTVGLELANQQLKFGNAKLSDDQLRVLYARVEHLDIDPKSIRGIGGYTTREPRWRSDMTFEVRQGLDAFGASKPCTPLANCLPPNTAISNFGADPHALVARFDGSAEFRPVPHLTIAMREILQVASGPLLPYEQVSFGDYGIGRGLDPGTVLADDGFGASLELRYGSPYADRPGSFGFEPFVFVDYAKAWIDDNLLNPDPHDVLTAGGGVRGRWGDNVDFGVTVAAPLQRAGYQTQTGPVRVLLTLSARLLPWGERR
jgi:hemolysin activation/secretion protein